MEQMKLLPFACHVSQKVASAETPPWCDFFETLWPTPYVLNLLFLLSCLAVPFPGFLLGMITSPVKRQHRSFTSGSVFWGNPGCVTLSNLLTLSELQISHFEKGGNNGSL